MTGGMERRACTDEVIAQIAQVIFTGLETLPSYEAFMSAIMKRQHKRHRMVEPVKLWLASSTDAIHCMLMDISQGGAHLRTPVGFQEHGEVLLSSHALGHKQPARIVWRDATSIGVSFT